MTVLTKEKLIKIHDMYVQIGYLNEEIRAIDKNKTLGIKQDVKDSIRLIEKELKERFS